MTELKAEFAIFKDPWFLLTVLLVCSLLVSIGGVIWYVQT